MSSGRWGHWRELRWPALLYLLHVALLTSSLAATSLLFNVAILALGHPRSLLGLLGSTSVVVALVLSLPLWWLVGRWGPLAALIISALFQAASALTIAVLPTTVPLLIATAGTGIAAVLFQVSAAPLMMQHSDDTTRDTLFSASAATNLGLAGVGSLLGGYLPLLLGRAFGLAPESPAAYRLSFAVAGAGLLLAIVPLLLIARRPLFARPAAQGSVADSTSRAKGSWRGLLTHPWPLIQLLVPPGLISLGAALLIPYLNLFFKERWGSDDALLGIIFAALGVGTGLGALAAPALSARLGTIRAVAWAQLASIPFLLLVGFAPLLWVAVGAALMRGALFNLGSPLYDAFAMHRTDPGLRPIVIGFINAAYAGGYIVAPPLSVYVQERYGWSPLFCATALCYAAAIAATYWFFIRPNTSSEKLAAYPNDPAH